MSRLIILLSLIFFLGGACTVKKYYLLPDRDIPGQEIHKDENSKIEV